jgi:hypothetical protein
MTLTRFALEVTTTTLVKGHDEFFTDIQYFAGTFATMNNKIRFTHNVTKTFSTEAEARDRVKTLKSCERTDNSISTHSFQVISVDYTHANHQGYSDTSPYEIVRVVSDKTIELRAMTAERDENWKPEFIPGGFSAHCTNNGDQRSAWIIKSNPENYTVRARLQKDGSWKSEHGRHTLSKAPAKHYDYNF